ncbi:acyltransferase [Aureispira anguillae]|uniref:N-acetyltransferase n=1 Tax=Aureispira anguillae TaxID=2864201 RepID=A0A916DWD0_9BACT|nr:acyltransferase [Aureispira anguillae]BDS14667.1 N-acetyltransferase [Aureispira anguillae]
MIHETALVQSKQIGKGTNIWQFVVVLPKASIGENVNICSHCFIENDVTIGDNVTIKCGVQVWDGITIQDNVFIGPNVTFTNDLYPRSKQYAAEWTKTKIELGASIGANATIMAGITVGSFAMVGAGSVVTKDLPPYTLWYGNPAVHKGYVTETGEILDLQLFSKQKQAQYIMVNGKPVLQD